MSGAGGRPAACLQRALILPVSAGKLTLLGVIWSLADVPLGRSYWRRVCPKKSKPWAMGVMTVFIGDSLTPRSAKKALIRGRTVSSRTCRELAVTMKSSGHRTSLMLWTRRCQLPPCTTASSPSHTILRITGEIMPPCGTPSVVGYRVPRSIKPLRSHFDNTRLFMGMGAAIHEKRM
jgi:hypothetical protein